MSTMTPLLLIIAVIGQFQGIAGQKTINPNVNQFCPFDAFISSKPIGGKVFLVPAVKAERTSDWWQARAYCAKNCAEMVSIRNATENQQFHDFLIEINSGSAVWLGAEIIDKQLFTAWTNGDPATYQPTKPGEYNEVGHSCASQWDFNQLGFCNDSCDWDRLIACQRSENWLACEG